ncbi:hypothetical protein QBC43DRAFT_369621 [Cladorrhinum sp. PSN259]|nr:hypothetical protein QBC43DRAFT_369621 [Cladorrhinum sp. PSN259]
MSSDQGIPDYKPQIDSKAIETRNPAPPAPTKEPSGLVEKVEKVAKNVPVLGSILGSTSESEKKPQQAQQPTEEVPSNVPPVRPHQDTQIEEFIRDQHHSKGIMGEDQV